MRDHIHSWVYGGRVTDQCNICGKRCVHIWAKVDTETQRCVKCGTTALRSKRARERDAECTRPAQDAEAPNA